MSSISYNSPIGKLLITEENGAITNIFFDSSPICTVPKQPTPLLEKTIIQLDEYFQGNRKQFDIPLSPKGTPFQQKVWSALLTIPYGKTVNYAELSQQIDNPKAYRAVGQANKKNPIIIVIPCHRVIGKNGSLTGYSEGIDIKKQAIKTRKNYLKIILTCFFYISMKCLPSTAHNSSNFGFRNLFL